MSDWVLLSDGHRLLWAALTLFGFAGMCLWAWVKDRRRDEGGAPDFLILSASQTGQALELSQQAEAQLRAGGKVIRRRTLREVTPDELSCAPVILCIASTTGEGDAPDEALVFERRMASLKIDLAHQTYAVLALGDRKYEKFCAFGHRLHDWLGRHGARALKPCLEVDDLDTTALSRWQDWLKGWGAAGEATEVAFTPATLVARERFNPQSDAPGLFHIAFECAEEWQAGDLIEIRTPDGHKRDYSIASVPAEGQVSLYVREVIRPDGSYGLGSGLLAHATPVGGEVPVRIKAHEGFRAPDGTGPVLLIGAGSGLAGLRGHLIELAIAHRQSWLIYGERHPLTDGRLCDDMRQWHKDGRLTRLDLAFSRPDDGVGQYVQDVLRQQADKVRAYLSGGSVMVCGGRDMGRGIDEALREIMGEDWVDAALASGAYRRDLY